MDEQRISKIAGSLTASGSGRTAIDSDEAEDIIKDCYDLVDSCPNEKLPSLYKGIRNLIKKIK